MPKVKDPVCGMMIDSETATARLELDGQTYYFCSMECRAVFEANPDRFTGKDTQSAGEGEQLEQHEPPFTVTGFLTSPKFGAAGSGGLEYERLPEVHDPDDPKRRD